MTKTFLVTAALLDRILGLTGLLSLAGFFSVVYYKEVTTASPQITHIIFLNLILLMGTGLFFFLLLSPIHVQNLLLKFLPKKISSLLHQVFILRNNRKEIFICYLSSIFMQFLGILAFWTITSPFYATHLPLPYVFTFIPIVNPIFFINFNCKC